MCARAPGTISGSPWPSLCSSGGFRPANINVNRFSLHALYRNRLIRMFLGASNQEERKANPFTDFDQSDNLPMRKLWPAT